jgi:hypothetical protein
MHKKLTATKVDEANRIVLEFNKLPASKAYSEALGVLEEELPEIFMLQLKHAAWIQCITTLSLLSVKMGNRGIIRVPIPFAP